MLPIQWLQPIRLPEISTVGLLMKSSQYASDTMLIVGEDEFTAIFLSDQFQYEMMPCAEADSWTGIFIADVELRVDPSSACDLQSYRPPLGCVTFGKDGICIIATDGGNRMFPRSKRIPLGRLSPMQTISIEVGFTRWEIGRLLEDRWVSLWEAKIQLPPA